MNFERIRITARELVGHELGPSRMDPKTVETALGQARHRGFIPSFIPAPGSYHQHIVLVRVTHPMAAIFRALAPDGSPTPTPCGLIESRTKCPINQVGSGLILAQFGLAILRVAGCNVILRGTSSEMAHDATFVRYTRLSMRPCWMVIKRATGLAVPPNELDDDLRLRAAYVYDDHGVIADGLLNDGDNCTLTSPWRFQEPQTQPDGLTPPF